MVAFHFPPQRGSSGIQRTLAFARYLPEFGWDPAVLTVHPRAYESVDGHAEIPVGVTVHRTLAFDASRDFAIRGRYPSFFARPDRWASWRWFATAKGMDIVRHWKPDVLWSTYPIATAHAIAHSIARAAGTPWVADFRDPMTEDGYPTDPKTWKSYWKIESRAIALAKRAIFTTPGAAAAYRRRYPNRAERIVVIENGYDEEMFDASAPSAGAVPAEGRFVLLHSGIVYPSERDPTALFEALHALRNSRHPCVRDLVVRFRAPVHTRLIEDLGRRYGVLDMVDVAPAVQYRAALAEMQQAGGLLVLQASNCNDQIPAKMYEYLRAGRPILCLADSAGDTAGALRRAGVRHIAALDDANAIADVLARFIRDAREARAPLPDPEVVRRSSRRERTADLARVLGIAAGA